MFEGHSWIFFLTVALIGASVIDDLRSRKVHNSLVTSIFVVSCWAQMHSNGLSALPAIGTSMLAAFAFGLPLYLIKAFGGGDFKLVVAFSPLLGWMPMAWTLVFSLVWAAILGLLMIVLRGEGKKFVRNLASVALRNSVSPTQLHKLPYTVAILCGFMTQAALAERGVSIL